MDLAGLSPPLAAVVTRVLEARPACEAQLSIEASARAGSADVGLVARLRSPTGVRESDLWLWDQDGNGDLGVWFRMCDTHPENARWFRDFLDRLDATSAFVAVVIAIIDGEIVSFRDHAPWVLFERWIDLLEPDVLLDELTYPRCTGRATTWTWSGKGDREVSLADLQV